MTFTVCLILAVDGERSLPTPPRTLDAMPLALLWLRIRPSLAQNELPRTVYARSNKLLPRCVLIIPDRCLLTVPVFCAAIIVRFLLALHTPRSLVWKWLRLVRLSTGYAAGN